MASVGPPINRVYDQFGIDINAGKRDVWYIGAAIACIAMLITFGLGGDSAGGKAAAIFGIMLFLAGSSICGYAVVSAGKAERRYLSDQAQRDAQNIAKTEEIVAMQKSSQQVLTELQAREVGNNIVASGQSTVVVGSILVNSLNSYKEVDPKLAEAITTVAGFIDHENNKQAAEYFAEFTKKLAAKDSALTLKALWGGVLQALPSIATLAGAVATISKAISGS